MTAHKLFPSAVEIDYHSAFAPHKMTIPTGQWSPGAGFGTFLAWDASNVDAETMIDDLLDLMANFFTAAVVFDHWTIFNGSDPDLPLRPQVEKAVTVPGTGTTTLPVAANQATWSFRTTAFGYLKIVMLDLITEGNYSKITSGTVTTDESNFIAAITADTNAWSGRDNAQPNSFRQISRTLNEKLRKSYFLN